MRTKDMKTGVVYAAKNGRYGRSEPVMLVTTDREVYLVTGDRYPMIAKGQPREFPGYRTGYRPKYANGSYRLTVSLSPEIDRGKFFDAWANGTGSVPPAVALMTTVCEKLRAWIKDIPADMFLTAPGDLIPRHVRLSVEAAKDIRGDWVEFRKAELDIEAARAEREAERRQVATAEAKVFAETAALAAFHGLNVDPGWNYRGLRTDAYTQVKTEDLRDLLARFKNLTVRKERAG